LQSKKRKIFKRKRKREQKVKRLRERERGSTYGAFEFVPFKQKKNLFSNLTKKRRKIIKRVV